MPESFDEDEVIIRVINENIQILLDSQEVQLKAIVKLQESLTALRDYHSREIIKGVFDNINVKPF
jgi:hypothetical protein